MDGKPGGIQRNTGKTVLPDNDQKSSQEQKTDKQVSKTDSGRQIEVLPASEKTSGNFTETPSKKEETSITQRTASINPDNTETDLSIYVDASNIPSGWETFDDDNASSKWETFDNDNATSLDEFDVEDAFTPQDRRDEPEKAQVDSRIADIARQLQEENYASSIEKRARNKEKITLLKEETRQEIEDLREMQANCERRSDENHKEIERLKTAQYETGNPDSKKNFQQIIESLESIIADRKKVLNSLIKEKQALFDKLDRHNIVNQELNDQWADSQIHKIQTLKHIMVQQERQKIQRKEIELQTIQDKGLKSKLATEIRQQRKALHNKTKELDKEIKQLAKKIRGLQRPENYLHELWEKTRGLDEIEKVSVYSAENMPFAIDPKGTQPISYDQPLFAPLIEDTPFSDSAPLLAGKEQLRDNIGNALFEPKTDKKSQEQHAILEEELEREWLIREELAQKGTLSEAFLDSINEPAIDENKKKISLEQRRANVLDRKVLKPYQELTAYQQDKKKPVYGYSPNDNPTLVNKKKLRQYKGATRIPGRIKTYFQKKGARVKNYVTQLIDKLSSRTKMKLTVMAMSQTPDNIFYKELQNPEFARLFMDMYTSQCKRDTKGLQQFHDLMATSLNTKLKFSTKERACGYDTAMATLIMVGAGLVDGNDKESDTTRYRGLDSPVERATGVRLHADATPEQRDQVLKEALRKKSGGTHSHIKPSHLLRATDLLNEMVSVKNEVEAANEKARDENRLEDVRDANEVAKQKLIDAVIVKARKKLPGDIRGKLEIMLQKYDTLPEDDTASPRPKGKMIPPESWISELQERVDNAQWAGDDRLARKMESKIESLKQEREEHIARLSRTRKEIDEALSKAEHILPETREIISQAILVHCGMLTCETPETSKDIQSYQMSEEIFMPHQWETAKVLAEEITDYINPNKTQGAEVYTLLTNYSPLSASDGDAAHTKNAPLHFLHQTDCKSQLEASFKKSKSMNILREASSHINPESREKQISMFYQAREEVNQVLSEAVFVLPETLDMLSQGILAHCGLLACQTPETSSNLQSYQVNGEDFQPHQWEKAKALAERLRDHINSGEATGTEVYKLLTEHPPLSADDNEAVYAENTPPHFLHQTTLRPQLEMSFEKIKSMDILREAIDDTGESSEELASLLASHVVASACTRSSGEKEDKSGEYADFTKPVLKAVQTDKIARLSQELASLLETGDANTFVLAKQVYPMKPEARKEMIRQLRSRG